MTGGRVSSATVLILKWRTMVETFIFLFEFKAKRQTRKYGVFGTWYIKEIHPKLLVLSPSARNASI